MRRQRQPTMRTLALQRQQLAAHRKLLEEVQRRRSPLLFSRPAAQQLVGSKTRDPSPNSDDQPATPVSEAVSPKDFMLEIYWRSLKGPPPPPPPQADSSSRPDRAASLQPRRPPPPLPSPSPTTSSQPDAVPPSARLQRSTPQRSAPPPPPGLEQTTSPRTWPTQSRHRAIDAEPESFAKSRQRMPATACAPRLSVARR